MPELPEVRVVSKTLNDNLKGKTITSVVVNLPKLIKNKSKTNFIKNLECKIIKSVDNKGKFIVFHLSGDMVLVSHLRMEGKYRVTKDDEFTKHDHIIFKLNSEYLVYSDTRQFGTFHLFSESEYLYVPPLNKMANEPQDIDPKELFEKFKNKSIAIKTSLLDQSLVSGLGNIYVNEVLWDQKILPTRKTNDISLKELKGLLESSARIMDESTKMGGTTIHSFKSFNDSEGHYQDKLKVHGKENHKCPRCGTLILKTRVNGRGTYYCQKCQK